MAHYKPKTASLIYSEARVVLLREPWLTYPQAWQKMINPCVIETVSVYGSSIRHEIGCELRSVNKKERLEVDYVKYVAACELYGVPALTVKSLLKSRSKSRDIVVNEHLPAPPEVIVVPETVLITESFNLGGDIKAKKAKLTRAFEEAELRMSEAGLELRGLETQRKDLVDQLAALDEKIGAQRQIIDEATQAMDVMLTLVDAPDAVIDLVL